jgi:hypothetical protein
MTRRATVRYRLTSTYTKTVDLDALAEVGVPTDDLDELADWLQDNPASTSLADLSVTDNWVDCDPMSAQVLHVEDGEG